MIWNQQVHGRLYAMIYTELFVFFACVCMRMSYVCVCVCMQHEHMYVFCVCLQLFMMSLVTMWVKGTDHSGQPGVPPQQAADPLWPYFSHVAGQVCVLNIYHA